MFFFSTKRIAGWWSNSLENFELRALANVVFSFFSSSFFFFFKIVFYMLAFRARIIYVLTFITVCICLKLNGPRQLFYCPRVGACVRSYTVVVATRQYAAWASTFISMSFNVDNPSAFPTEENHTEIKETIAQIYYEYVRVYHPSLSARDAVCCVSRVHEPCVVCCVRFFFWLIKKKLPACSKEYLPCV